VNAANAANAATTTTTTSTTTTTPLFEQFNVYLIPRTKYSPIRILCTFQISFQNTQVICILAKQQQHKQQKHKQPYVLYCASHEHHWNICTGSWNNQPRRWWSSCTPSSACWMPTTSQRSIPSWGHLAPTPSNQRGDDISYTPQTRCVLCLPNHQDVHVFLSAIIIWHMQVQMSSRARLGRPWLCIAISIHKHKHNSSMASTRIHS
jgi:hypothetical protein